MGRTTPVELIQDHVQDVVDAVRAPLLILDGARRVLFANRAFYHTFRVSPGETEGRLVYELGDGRCDVPGLRTLLEVVVPENPVLDDFEIDHDFPGVGRRVLQINARTIRLDEAAELVVLAMEDLTALRRADEELERANARLTKAVRTSSREMAAAVKIQEALLPPEGLRVPGMDFAWIYRPCEELAGDGLNVIPFGGGRAGLYLLDVCGHGIAAALLSVTLSRVLTPPPDPPAILTREGGGKSRPEIKSPAEVADVLNRLFPFDAATEQFASLVYGVLDAEAGSFRFVSAGHPGPVHLPAGAGPTVLESRGFPIGLRSDRYEDRCVGVGPGDRLYLYSDGVVEATNPAGECFGEARLLESLDGARSAPLRESLAALMVAIEEWGGARGVQDDVSILAVEVSAAAGRGDPRAG